MASQFPTRFFPVTKVSERSKFMARYLTLEEMKEALEAQEEGSSWILEDPIPIVDDEIIEILREPDNKRLVIFNKKDRSAVVITTDEKGATLLCVTRAAVSIGGDEEMPIIKVISNYQQ